MLHPRYLFFPTLVPLRSRPNEVTRYPPCNVPDEIKRDLFVPDHFSDRTKQQYAICQKIQKTEAHLTQNKAVQTWNGYYSNNSHQQDQLRIFSSPPISNRKLPDICLR